MILLTQTKTHYTFPNLDNGISLFCYSYSGDGDHLRQQHYLSESNSTSLTDTNYVQNQGSNLVTISETETKELPKIAIF